MKRIYFTVLALGTLWLPPIASRAQAPGGAAQRSTATSYIAVGSSAEADVARLRDAIAKLPGVENVDVAVKPGRVTLRITGTALGTLFAAVARNNGYALHPTPLRSFTASSISSDASLTALKEALAKVDGVEQVLVGGQATGAAVRVLGEVKAADLAVAAKSAGFELVRSGSYVASGSSDATAIANLRRAISQAPGVSQVDARQVGGGATLRIQGVMEDEDLVSASKSAGFGLLPLSDPVGGQFRLAGTPDAAARDAILKAIQAVSGGADVQVDAAPNGARVQVLGGTATPQAIVGAAKRAGFELQSQGDASSSSAGAEVERSTPPSPNDRVLEDLTTAGSPAPDFTLITREGKGRVSLSEFRGKKPVVLIFGSYT